MVQVVNQVRLCSPTVHRRQCSVISRLLVCIHGTGPALTSLTWEASQSQ